MRDVVILVGSLRKESFTRKIAKVLEHEAPQALSCTFVEIGGLPLYHPDLETERPPAEWVEFRERVQRADAVLFATPEYNRSVPAVLKNAIDVGSRPMERSVWKGKPAAVVSVSPGAIAGFGANHHLRQMLVFLDMPTLQAPEAYIGGVNKMLTDQGNLTSDSTRQFLAKFMAAFAEWIERVGATVSYGGGKWESGKGN